jgi:hypothetical protein
MWDYAKGVKKVPLDGTHENFYLWTTQLLGFAETYNCEQALLGQLKVPASTRVIDPTKDADKKRWLQGVPIVQPCALYAYPSQIR